MPSDYEKVKAALRFVLSDECMMEVIQGLAALERMHQREQAAIRVIAAHKVMAFRNRELRFPVCPLCQLDARIEELSAALSDTPEVPRG